jgi:hypothetical protein
MAMLYRVPKPKISMTGNRVFFHKILLGRVDKQFGRWKPVFQTNLLTPSSAFS